MHTLTAYRTDMQTANYSPRTVNDRIDLLTRLEAWLGLPLIEATAVQLAAWQRQFRHLQPATVDIYTRHTQAFYRWAAKRGLIERDPAVDLIRPKLHRGLPHPTSLDDLRLIFAVTTGPLRLPYLLATFAGLRCMEICALDRSDLDLDREPWMLIHGKGGRVRRLPVLPPILEALPARSGRVARTWTGLPWTPKRLSVESHRHLHGLGLSTTLHSMRHTFLTHAARMTRDPLFVRDLAGHVSVATTEIYMQSSLEGAHDRLAAFTRLADDVTGTRRLRAVT